MTRSLLDRVTATLPTVSGGRWIVAEIHATGAFAAYVIAIAADWLPDPERLHHVTRVRCHAADLLLDAGFYLEGRAANALWICDDSAVPSDRGTDMDAALDRYLAASDALRPLRGEVVKVERRELEMWYHKHESEE